MIINLRCISKQRILYHFLLLSSSASVSSFLYSPKSFVSDWKYDPKDPCEDTKCPSGTECHPTIDSYTCDDIDECKHSAAICPVHSYCVNSVGSYGCECYVGYSGMLCTKDAWTQPSEIMDYRQRAEQHTEKQNEPIHYPTKMVTPTYGLAKGVQQPCASKPCGQHGMCVSDHGEGKFTCYCYEGYHGIPCLDVDECTRISNACTKSTACVNTIGSYKCFGRQRLNCPNFCDLNKASNEQLNPSHGI